MTTPPGEPVYLVCGYPRSGTSMLMRCLEAGGVPCVYDRRHDAALNQSSSVPGYVPNPHGFYEMPDRSHRHADWAQFRGKAIKCLHDELAILRPGHRYRAAYLTRDPAEIRRSFAALVAVPRPPQSFAFLEDYAAGVAADVETLSGRWAADVTVMHYPDVVADPAGQLARLAAAGWPVDVAAAEGSVDPALYRNRGAA